MSVPAANKPSKAGISTTSSGARVIASSVRADGSIRKEIRVRPGYKPPEDVEVYKNRTAEAWKNRGIAGIPGTQFLASVAGSGGKESGTAASNKNAERKEARRKAAASSSLGGDGPEDAIDAAKVSTDYTTNASATGEVKEPVDPEADKEKEARKLAKKLRQARDLKDKKEKGDALLPEQFEKVIKISELMRQLGSLGFDANGEKKVASDGE